MSFSPNPSTPVKAPAYTGRALAVRSHPGGLYPGVELPASWVPEGVQQVELPSPLPQPGDREGIAQAVQDMCLNLREAALAVFAAGGHPILVGGDHSLAMGTLAAATRVHERLAVIWVDAHADFNTYDTSPTGNPHGMPLAVACGLGHPRFTGMFENFVHPVDVVIIGARDIDVEEARLLETHGVWQVSVAELRRLGVPQLVQSIRERLGALPVHLSFDFDAVSAEYFSATGTPVANGLTPDEAEALVRGLKGLQVVSNDWVEFDPRHPQAEDCAGIARRLFSAFHAE